MERVTHGVSTWVYRIAHGETTAYLRVLPEAGASFAPEVLVHWRLRALGVRVPEVIYFEDGYAPLQRSVMVVSEIHGSPLASSAGFAPSQLDTIATAAGCDLARINAIAVEGFGWVRRDQADEGPAQTLRAELPSHRAFALEYWDDDLAYLAGTQTLAPQDIAALERTVARHDAWLDEAASVLAHGDFDTTAIYHVDGRYSGIIDFGEIRGASRWYDLGYFHMRDGEGLRVRLLPSLVRGYNEVAALPDDHVRRIRFASVLINVRALVRSLRKHPPNRHTQHQIARLREDIDVLST